MPERAGPRGVTPRVWDGASRGDEAPRLHLDDTTVTNPDGSFPLEFEDAVVAAGPGDTAGPARDTTIIMSSR